MIPTPKVDWLALSPTLALLGASGVALLGSVLVPWWLRRAFTAFVVFAGFVTAGVFAGVVFDRSAESESRSAHSARPILFRRCTCRCQWPEALGFPGPP